MYDAPTPLRHSETPRADDTALAQASRSHVAGNGALQLIAELVFKLRGARFSWWTPEILRDTWSATERMGWFSQRSDIRQRITCSLTGLKPKAARNKKPDYQGALIDSIIDDGDVTVDEFEKAFDAIELAAYAPANEIWHRFRERMTSDQDTQVNQALTAWLIERFLASSSTIDGMTRKPILTPHAIRTAIPGKIWHSKLPLEIRVAIDELRLKQEATSPGEPFRASHDLSVATPAIIAANIPLRDLVSVLDAADQAMGLPSSAGVPARPVQPRRMEGPAAVKAEAPQAEPARAEVQKVELGKAEPSKIEPSKVEPLKVEAKVQPIARHPEKAPEKPAEKPIDKPAESPSRPAERWERMAKVFETVAKEGDTAEGSAERP